MKEKNLTGHKTRSPSGRDDVLLMLVLYSHVDHRFIAQPMFCRCPHHLSLTEAFGEHIATQRKQLKISQDELAKRVGTSAPIIGRDERGEIKPSIEMAKKMADELGVTVDYLIGGSTSMVLDKKLLKRIEDIEALPNEEEEKIYYFIDMAITYNKTKKAYSR
jgi:transcriptional regulator with XRE-family HTH domain